MESLDKLEKELRKVSSGKKAKSSSQFFKTGEGQYGHGDKFLGVTMPELRVIAKKYFDLNFAYLEKLLRSEFHEERSIALIILVEQFERVRYCKLPQAKKDILATHTHSQKDIFDFYVEHIKCVNNWDLVDMSAPSILGEYLLDKKITLMLTYAKNQNLWLRRTAIVSTFAFIKNKSAKETFLISDLLLDDREDLIQKAVGWMLREVGKRVSKKNLEMYLSKNYKKMGRKALRYAIEHFDSNTRQKYLKGLV